MDLAHADLAAIRQFIGATNLGKIERPAEFRNPVRTKFALQ
jgi:hypothetical protein